MTTKAEREANAARERAWVAEQEAKGLNRIRVWAHLSNEARIRAYAKRVEKDRKP